MHHALPIGYFLQKATKNLLWPSDFEIILNLPGDVYVINFIPKTGIRIRAPKLQLNTGF